MSENSKIEWTDHTFNPWWGCQKVSDGCKHCYAETLDNRYNHDNPHWGPTSDRKAMSEAYWRQPVKWNAEAKKAGVKKKVFCASMADVFEGHPQTIEHLNRLFLLITDTPYLIWQLLTKRPKNILGLIPELWRTEFPHNVWRGTSVENQNAADERIPHLLEGPPGVRFLSCEPLLSPVDLRAIKQIIAPGFFGDCLQWYHKGKSHEDEGIVYPKIDWVIAGGESGPHARPMHLNWARALRDQCEEAGTAFHFKQWGEWKPAGLQRSGIPGRYALAPIEGEGPIMEIGQYPRQFTAFGSVVLERVGKKVAGRLLDGRTHDEFPQTLTH